jgi:AcrR family transcriptional regulator
VSDTRQRIVGTTADLFRERGYTGTGIKQIARESGAAFGSLYHFFPGGKDELAAEALRWSGAGYQLLVEAVIDAAPDYVTGLRDAFTGAAEVLEATDYADACPIETVALEVASVNEPLRLVTAEIFESWIESGTTRGVAAGLDRAAARRLAIAFVNALEGAFVLARAMKSTEPMFAAADAIVPAAEAALAATAAKQEGSTR